MENQTKIGLQETLKQKDMQKTCHINHGKSNKNRPTGDTEAPIEQISGYFKSP